MAKIIRHIADLIPDPNNARQHNERNVGMVERALNEVGTARSIVVDEDGVILAGNATIEAAAAAGIERVLVVDSDGETIIAVRRTGLTAEQKTKLSIYDNRAAELATWNIVELMTSQNSGIDLSPMFSSAELDVLLSIAYIEAEQTERTEQAANNTAITERWTVTVQCANERQQIELSERLMSEGYTCSKGT